MWKVVLCISNIIKQNNVLTDYTGHYINIAYYITTVIINIIVQPLVKTNSTWAKHQCRHNNVPWAVNTVSDALVHSRSVETEWKGIYHRVTGWSK